MNLKAFCGPGYIAQADRRVAETQARAMVMMIGK
jgi:hypothetical protein